MTRDQAQDIAGERDQLAVCHQTDPFPWTVGCHEQNVQVQRQIANPLSPYRDARSLYRYIGNEISPHSDPNLELPQRDRNLPVPWGTLH